MALGNLSNPKVERFVNWAENQGTAEEITAQLDEDILFTSPALPESRKGKAMAMHFFVIGQVALGQEHFKYVDIFDCGDKVVLEFESMVLGKAPINGVQILKWNEDGLITEYKAMMRPLDSLQKLFAHMKSGFDKLRATGELAS